MVITATAHTGRSSEGPLDGAGRRGRRSDKRTLGAAQAASDRAARKAGGKAADLRSSAKIFRAIFKEKY